MARHRSAHTVEKHGALHVCTCTCACAWRTGHGVHSARHGALRMLAGARHAWRIACARHAWRTAWRTACTLRMPTTCTLHVRLRVQSTAHGMHTPCASLGFEPEAFKRAVARTRRGDAPSLLIKLPATKPSGAAKPPPAARRPSAAGSSSSSPPTVSPSVPVPSAGQAPLAAPLAALLESSVGVEHDLATQADEVRCGYTPVHRVHPPTYVCRAARIPPLLRCVGPRWGGRRGGRRVVGGRRWQQQRRCG